MDPRFFRKYSDLIVEAEQTQQIDEGLLQDIKTKASSVISQFKSVPGIGGAYKRAKAFAPELKQIFASAKSGQEVIDGIKSLVASKSGANALAEDVSLRTGASAVAATAYITWEVVSGFLETCIHAALQGNAAGIYFVVMPILLAIAAFFMMFHETDGR